MTQSILIPRFGFHNHVVANVGGMGEAPLPYQEQSYDFSALVGVAVIVPGTANGLRVSGLHGGAAGGNGWAYGLRFVICSLPGDPRALAGIIQNLPQAIGGRYSSGNGPPDQGLLVPDLSTMAFNPALAAAAITPPPGLGVANPLVIHFDETAYESGGIYQYTMDKDPILIPANTSVAALFIRLSDTNAEYGINSDISVGQTVGGALVGSEQPAPPPGVITGLTPARTGNVVIPGALAPR